MDFIVTCLTAIRDRLTIGHGQRVGEVAALLTSAVPREENLEICVIPLVSSLLGLFVGFRLVTFEDKSPFAIGTFFDGRKSSAFGTMELEPEFDYRLRGVQGFLVRQTITPLHK